jgi:hypothetical protein
VTANFLVFSLYIQTIIPVFLQLLPKFTSPPA